MKRIRLDQTELEFMYGVGCVAARKNRTSGALHQLYRPKSQTDDDGWLLICVDHGNCLVVDSRRIGEQQLASTEWCEGCCTASQLSASRAKESVALTKPQLRELTRLGWRPQQTYGRGRARVQNNLVAMKLAKFIDVYGRPLRTLSANQADLCAITDAGRDHLDHVLPHQKFDEQETCDE